MGIYDAIPAQGWATAHFAPRLQPVRHVAVEGKSSNQSRCSPARWALMMRDAMKAKVMAALRHKLTLAPFDDYGRQRAGFMVPEVDIIRFRDQY